MPASASTPVTADSTGVARKPGSVRIMGLWIPVSARQAGNWRTAPQPKTILVGKLNVAMFSNMTD